VLITVDNGIASLQGVAHARALGLQVLVTDHHLPAASTSADPLAVPLPDADVIVNPNQPGCPFESKSIAGVGVMFYVLLALRSELRTRGVFDKPSAAGPPRVEQALASPLEGASAPLGGSEPRAAGSVGARISQPKLDPLLPLVALGTVADVVRLDANNRRLVAQGLKRVRALAMPAGLASLFVASGRTATAATTFDFGFALGPRINAAGRLSDMTLGIECLLTDDPARADELAKMLDGINRERRTIEGDMREQAFVIAESLFEEGTEPPPAICVFDPDFHEGVVGIVASRLKDKMHRPVFVFAASSAPGREHELKGSGRSIPGFHLRDALDLVAKRHPGVLLRFGGHAMAAGCTIHEDALDTFEQGLTAVAQEWLDAATLTRRLETDGPLKSEYRRVDLVDALHHEVWGQGFAAPTFSEPVEVVSQRIVGEKHLSLKLKHQGQPVDAIWFGHTEQLPAKVRMAFRLDADAWNGVRRVRFLVEAVEL
jgi:single-stranded-DNA-specific exonuclease